MSWLWTPKVLHWGPNDPIKFWKPSFLQRVCYYLKLIPDPRYNGNKHNYLGLDEAGQMKHEKR